MHSLKKPRASAQGFCVLQVATIWQRSLVTCCLFLTLPGILTISLFSWGMKRYLKKCLLKMERETGLEPATPTLARRPKAQQKKTAKQSHFTKQLSFLKKRVQHQKVRKCLRVTQSDKPTLPFLCHKKYSPALICGAVFF
jgi:hypothetical protein